MSKFLNKGIFRKVAVVAIMLFGIMVIIKARHDSLSPDETLRLALDERDVFHDKTGRFRKMGILTHSYLDYDFYGAFLLPINSNQLEDALPIPSVQPSREPGRWGGSQANGLFTWDTRWRTPKVLKVWYERVMNEKLTPSGPRYDKYTERRSAPGTVWCEATVTIYASPPDDPGYLIFHFYPDGHIESEISALLNIAAASPRYTERDRGNLTKLTSQSCTKQIDNPYFGTKRPIPIN